MDPGHKTGIHTIQSPEPPIHGMREQPTYIDKTAYHPDQAHWTIENLPSVLYVLRPGTQYSKSRARIRQTSNAIFGRHIREFLVLPQQISTQVEGWRLEAWWRLDRRIEPQDILDRMDPQLRAYNGVEETELEMRREHFRREFYVADWRSQVSMNDLTRAMRQEGLDPVVTNSTRGITPGLINPEEGESAGRIPIARDCSAHNETRSLCFVFRGTEKSVLKRNADRTVSSDGIVFDTPSPRRETRPAINTCQGSAHNAPSIYMPPSPTIKSPQPLKRMAPKSDDQVTFVPQKRRATEDGIIFNGREINVETKKRDIYPDSHCELAIHQNTPGFSEQGIPNESAIMTLEEYLDRHQMTFDEYLCREENEKKKEKQNTRIRKIYREKALVTTPGKGNVVDPWLTVL